MSKIEIIEVKSKKEQKSFVNFPLKLYNGNPYFVPPLYGDELKMFKSSNIYNNVTESKFFLAIKDGKVVGRIQAMIQEQYNALHNEKSCRFTRFDAINDQEVATLLFEAAEKWAKEKGMDTIRGPLSFSDLEREGLLIAGFEELSTFEEQYNYPYYQELIENCNYEKEVDWLEFQLSKPKERNLKIKKIADRVMEANNLHMVDPNAYSKKDYLNTYKDSFFECLEESYAEIYQTVPFTEEMKNELISQFLLILNNNYLILICDETEKVVSFGLCFPGIGKALQKSQGHLYPLALLRLLRAAKKPDTIDLGLVAVRPEYQAKGVNAIILDKLLDILDRDTVKYCETNLNLEDNVRVISQWKYFESRQHKKRRAYIKKI